MASASDASEGKNDEKAEPDAEPGEGTDESAGPPPDEETSKPA